jgi:uncharacterized protein (DUF4415 family)
MNSGLKTIPVIRDADEARIQAQIAADPDAPEATDAQLAQARSFADIFPEFAEGIRRARGRPTVTAAKQQISLRLDPDVIEAFKRSGKGWQGRINTILRKAAGL